MAGREAPHHQRQRAAVPGRDFKVFIRLTGLTHWRTAPYYPQSNGKLERWHGSLKRECIRPCCPGDGDEARRRIAEFVEHYNYVRLHSAINPGAGADERGTARGGPRSGLGARGGAGDHRLRDEGEGPPGEGWTFGIERVHVADVLDKNGKVATSSTKLIGGWLPPEFAPDRRPYNDLKLITREGPGRETAWAFLVLAAIHDCRLNGVEEINPFLNPRNGDESRCRTRYHHLRDLDVPQLNTKDLSAIEDCFRIVERKLVSNDRPLIGTEQKPVSQTGTKQSAVSFRRTNEEVFKAALAKHHQYDGEFNYEPATTRGIEELSGGQISDTTAGRLLKQHFVSNQAYREACKNRSIRERLTVLLGEALRGTDPEVLDQVLCGE